jgi:uncharacterized repeat protein (TIGR03803 family)
VAGGAHNEGTVFALKLSGGSWSENVLHSFVSSISDGIQPTASLVMDASNNLWGTTTHGGAGALAEGVVFELTPTGNLFSAPWTETIIYNFCDGGLPCPEGAIGEGIVLDGSGNIFGTTMWGGTTGIALPATGGTFYELSPGASCPPTGWCETFTDPFCSGLSCNIGDGQHPPMGSAPVVDGSGDYWGVTSASYGGTGGVIWEYNGTTVGEVHGFCALAGCADGGSPLAGMTYDGSGNLWGTTTTGGANGDGTIYEYTP